MIHTEATKKKIAQIHRGKYVGLAQREALSRRNQQHPQPNSTRGYVPRPQTVRVPTGTDLAYLAGIVDGEGSIRFHDGRPFVAVYNNDEGLMKWLEQQTGKRFILTDLRGRVPGYGWYLQAANDVKALCEALLPYLIVKRKDAEIALAFIEQRYGR